MDRSQDNKRIAKNTALLYVRSLILLVITLYTSRVILKALGVEDYGIYNLVGGVVTMFAMISGTLSSASQRFITFALGEGNPDHCKKVFSNSITLHIVLGLIIVAILEIGGVWFLNHKLNIPEGRMAVANVVLQCSIATFFVNIISVPFNALIIAHEKMSAFAYISILEGVLKLLIAILLLYVWMDKLVLFAILQLALAVILRSIYSIYCNRHFEEAQRLKLHIDKGLFKDMFSFAGWNLFGQTSLVLRNQGVDIVLNMFFGVTVNAAKGVSNQVQRAVMQFVGNFQTALKPQLTKSVAQNDIQRTHELVIQGSRFSFYMMLLFTVPLIISSKEILGLWLVKVPDWASVFVQLTMFYLLLDTQSRFLMHAIMATGKIRNYQIVVGGTKLMAIPMAYLWLVAGGTPTVGIWVNIILEIICLGERLYFNKKMLNLPVADFLNSAFTKCFLVLIVAMLLPYLTYMYVTKNLWVVLPVSLASSLLAVYCLGLNKHERTQLISKAEKIIRKKI